MIKVLTGDIFETKMQTMVNTINCVGVMGKGIAKLFKQKYPDMYDDYVLRCKDKDVKEGVPYLYTDMFGNRILNFPTKNHWKDLSNLKSIEKGLDILVEYYRDWGIESIALPPLGCGNGGLLWQQVGPMMYQKLSKLEIPVEIYAPFGTEERYMKPEYLSHTIDAVPNAELSDREMPAAWMVILEVLYRLEQYKYTVLIGKTIFQKICYVVDLMDIDTKLQFKKGKYGPYSPDIQRVYLVFGRENLIRLERINNFSSIKTGVEYPALRARRIGYLEKYESTIAKIVDLFIRVKSTEHAEEIGTILYALQDVTASEDKDTISEKEFFDYVMAWKQNWNTELKRESIGSTIRYLAAKGFVNMVYSDDLVTEY